MAVIITICILLIFAYIFDFTSSKTKIPSVILLFILGWAVNQLAVEFNIRIPDLSSILPVLGIIGLILIVLEGALELELDQSKLSLIGKSSAIAFISILIISFGLSYAISLFNCTSIKIGLANSIPFAIISSAIAIPSAKNLLAKNKEFITYESSLSDILGVIFFNFITLNEIINTGSIFKFFVEIVFILLVSFVATLSLAYLMSKINHHIKFAPIFLMVFLIYAVSKVYHLPALIFIMLFGLFLGNIEINNKLKFIKKIRLEILKNEIPKFKELTSEIAFLIRSLFFLLFGFLIKTDELLNSETILWAVGITVGIFIVRFILLKLFKYKAQPLLFIAPRGLITILLFLSIPKNQIIELVNKSLIIQVIVLTTFIMMVGIMSTKNKKTT
jgi:potassium/hydrogen antiporter